MFIGHHHTLTQRRSPTPLSLGTVKNHRKNIYGKLSVLISHKLSAFRQKLATQPCNFRLTNVNAGQLAKTLAVTAFARIEVRLRQVRGS